MKKYLEITITIIGCVIAAAFAKSCVRTAFAQTTNLNQTQLIQNSRNEQTVGMYDIQGIRLHLPTRPVPKVINLPPEARNIIKSYKVFESQSGNTLVLVSHVVYTAPEVNLDGSANGSIAEVRALPNVREFTSNKENIVIAGLNGRRILMKYRMGVHSIETHGFVFSRGSEAWQIKVTGGSNEAQDVKKLADKILSSITISPNR